MLPCNVPVSARREIPTQNQMGSFLKTEKGGPGRDGPRPHLRLGAVEEA